MMRNTLYFLGGERSISFVIAGVAPVSERGGTEGQREKDPKEPGGNPRVRQYL